VERLTGFRRVLVILLVKLLFFLGLNDFLSFTHNLSRHFTNDLLSFFRQFITFCSRLWGFSKGILA
jgi:hypothetical protein